MVLAAENFRDLEYIVLRSIWLQKGAEIQTCSVKPISVGRFGYKVSHDLLISEAKASDYDAIFFVGGTGSLYFAEHMATKRLTLEFLSQNKYIGAICAAPRNFLTWGILDGKKCTGHNWDEKFGEIAEENGATYIPNNVVIDGNILTSDGPESAEQCANEFWKLINS